MEMLVETGKALQKDIKRLPCLIRIRGELLPAVHRQWPCRYDVLKAYWKECVSRAAADTDPGTQGPHCQSVVQMVATLFEWALRTTWAARTHSLRQIGISLRVQDNARSPFGWASTRILLEDVPGLLRATLSVVDSGLVLSSALEIEAIRHPPSVVVDIARYPHKISLLSLGERGDLKVEIICEQIRQVTTILMFPPILDQITQICRACDQQTKENICDHIAGALPAIIGAYSTPSTNGRSADEVLPTFIDTVVKIAADIARPRPEPLRVHGISDGPAM
jgi:hypothetical protein